MAKTSSDAMTASAIRAWKLTAPDGTVRATDETCIKTWARINGYKPTIENLLAYEEQGWRVEPIEHPAQDAALLREIVERHTITDGRCWLSKELLGRIREHLSREGHL